MPRFFETPIESLSKSLKYETLQERDRHAKDLEELLANFEGVMQEKEQLESQASSKEEELEEMRQSIESLEDETQKLRAALEVAREDLDQVLLDQEFNFNSYASEIFFYLTQL